MTAKHETCPECLSGNSIVVNSRPYPTKRVRRLQCRVCGARWTTYESLIDPDEIPQKMRERLSA